MWRTVIGGLLADRTGCGGWSETVGKLRDVSCCRVPQTIGLHHQTVLVDALFRRQARPIRVDSFDVTRDPHDRQSLHFMVECSKGTYVRTLAYDLGRALGTVAHLTALR